MNEQRLQEASDYLRNAIARLEAARDDVALMKDRMAAPEQYLDEAIANSKLAPKITSAMTRYLA